MEKIRNCIAKPDVIGIKGRYCWTIGVAPNQVITNVCPRAFQLIYHISHGSVETLCKEIKQGSISKNKPFNDRASFVESEQNTMNMIDTMCEQFNIKLNRSMKQVTLLNSFYYYFLIFNTYHLSHNNRLLFAETL